MFAETKCSNLCFLNDSQPFSLHAVRMTTCWALGHEQPPFMDPRPTALASIVRLNSSMPLFGAWWRDWSLHTHPIAGTCENCENTFYSWCSWTWWTLDILTLHCMYGWMDGCMDVWMYGRMDVWMYGCMDVWMYGCMDVCMYVCTYVRMYVCTYVRTYVGMDGWMDGCMHACMHVCMVQILFIYVYIYIYIYIHNTHYLILRWSHPNPPLAAPPSRPARWVALLRASEFVLRWRPSSGDQRRPGAMVLGLIEI